MIPPTDNKFAALNSAVWSGGSFIYVPKGVHVDVPLQAYFRINTKNMGQFERTLIIVDEGAYVHYVEGCTAPTYSSDSLHSAVVEIIVKAGGRCRYTTIQNWSNNVYNLVTKRAAAYRDATMEWVDGNSGVSDRRLGVLVNNDVVPIAQIEPGAMVYSLNADMEWERRPVLAKRFSGRQQVHLLRTENHREVRATANHPFLTLTKQGKHVSLAWKRLDQLTTKDLVAISGTVPDHGKARSFFDRGRSAMRRDESGCSALSTRGSKSMAPPERHVVARCGSGAEHLPAPVHFSRVSAIEALDFQDTWDIEFEGTHNFVANGFVVHNSKLTMKYPGIYLLEPGAHGDLLSMRLGFAGKGQHQKRVRRGVYLRRARAPAARVHRRLHRRPTGTSARTTRTSPSPASTVRCSRT